MAFGWALSLFLALTFLICVAFDLIFPGYAMYETWAGLLPGWCGSGKVWKKDSRSMRSTPRRPASSPMHESMPKPILAR